MVPEEERRKALVILARSEEAARGLHSETAMDIELQLQVEEPSDKVTIRDENRSGQAKLYSK